MAIEKVGNIKGPEGRGIETIVRTEGNGAPGTTDTYTITYTDETTSTFQVRNGANGTDGIDGTDAEGGGGLSEEDILELIANNAGGDGPSAANRLRVIPIGESPQPVTGDKDGDFAITQNLETFKIATRPPYSSEGATFLPLGPALVMGSGYLFDLNDVTTLEMGETVNEVTMSTEYPDLEHLSWAPNSSTMVGRKVIELDDMIGTTDVILDAIKFTPGVSMQGPTLTFSTYVSYGIPLRFSGPEEVLSALPGIYANGAKILVLPMTGAGGHPGSTELKLNGTNPRVYAAPGGQTYLSLPSQDVVRAELASSLDLYGGIFEGVTVDAPDESIYVMFKKGYESDTTFEVSCVGTLNTTSPWPAVMTYIGSLLPATPVSRKIAVPPSTEMGSYLLNIDTDAGNKTITGYTPAPYMGQNPVGFGTVGVTQPGLYSINVMGDALAADESFEEVTLVINAQGGQKPGGGADQRDYLEHRMVLRGITDNNGGRYYRFNLTATMSLVPGSLVTVNLQGAKLPGDISPTSLHGDFTCRLFQDLRFDDVSVFA